jgi:hypothetical protein
MTAFLIRCATWALLGWLATTHPAVPLHVRHATDEWRAAWKVESPACGPRAYGLLFRSADCDSEGQ